MTFGEKIKMLRIEKGITQEKLGNIIGVSDRVIGYYESNNRFPKDDLILKKIADYFNVSLDYLLGRTESKEFIKNIDEKLKANDIAIAANSIVDLGKLIQVDKKTATLINTLIDDFIEDDNKFDKK